jgi:hypothetical protein
MQPKSTNPQQQWSGQLVARILGPDVEANYDQLRKMMGKCESFLSQGAGALW